jgi:hypothetical protein
MRSLVGAKVEVVSGDCATAREVLRRLASDAGLDPDKAGRCRFSEYSALRHRWRKLIASTLGLGEEAGTSASEVARILECDRATLYYSLGRP